MLKMSELTEQQVKDGMDLIAADVDNGIEDGREAFRLFQVKDYRGGKVYQRDFDVKGGTMFEFLLVYEGELYTHSMLVTSEGELTPEEMTASHAKMWVQAESVVDFQIDGAKDTLMKEDNGKEEKGTGG